MPIPHADIVTGGFYVTPTNQLRKVTGIVRFDDGTERINYLAKSDRIQNRRFDPGSTRANPPTRETFASDCERCLTDEDIRERRLNSIILDGE